VALQHSRHGATGVATALLLPFASVVLVFYRRRSRALRGMLGMLVLCGITFAAAAAMMGCRNSMTAATTPPTPITPTGSSQVTVTASSGSVSQTAMIALTVTAQ
jgi:apolipoprotein N-acyltransferase